jgi:hypothetical protein
MAVGAPCGCSSRLYRRAGILGRRPSGWQIPRLADPLPRRAGSRGSSLITRTVSNNIAEGFERGTKQELLTFLYIARGSAGEVRSMLCLLEKIPGFAGLESEILNFESTIPALRPYCE